MIDENLFDFIFESQPKFNPVLAKGIATTELRAPELLIDRTWRCAARLFPPGLTYEGYEICTPQEELFELTRRSGKQAYELAHSDVYLVKFNFHLDGKFLISRGQYMPAPDEANAITLRGSKFTLSPVLADRCLSVSKDTLFIPLLRDRLSFLQLVHTLLVDGQPKQVFVEYSRIHHHKQPPEVKRYPGNVNASTTLVHYLLCMYGMSGLFALAGAVPILIPEGADDTPYRADHVIVASNGWSDLGNPSRLRPRGVRNRDWQPPKFRLAIRKEEWSTTVESFAAGFFYVCDVFSDRILECDLEDTHLWRVLLGIAIFGNSVSEGKLYEDVVAHLSSLEEYIDEIAREDLSADRIMVSSAFELFVYVIENMTGMVVSTDVTNLEGKRLVTWKYVLFGLITAIFKFAYSLRSKNRKLSERDLITRFNRGITPELIMRINSITGIVSSISSPGDSMVLKYTSTVIPQSSASTSNRGKSAELSLDDPTLRPNATALSVGSYLNLPKSLPSPLSKANMYGLLGRNGEILIRESDREFLENVDADLI